MIFSQKKKNFDFILNENDKKTIQEQLKKDEFSYSDINLNYIPEISKIDYYRLKEMDFNWAILKPISVKVANYCEENKFNHRIGIKILNKYQKSLYFWWYLDGQVTNGGFSQFIYNGYDKYFPAILNGLKLLPNKEYYYLVEKVYLYYIQEDLANLDRNKIDYFKNKFYEDDFLSKADSLYFKHNDQLYIDFENFIRENQSQFIQPININFSGEITEKKVNEIEESILLADGIPNGFYTKKINDKIFERLKYENGIITEEHKYKNAVLFEKSILNNTNSTKLETIYYTSGVIKEEKLKKIIDKHNWNYITRKEFYENGNLSFEFYIDDEKKNNLKYYFDDGSIQRYSRSWMKKDNSWITENEYLICFDDNKKQTLLNGNGVFISKNESEYGKYEDIIHCNEYKANGESLFYKNGILWRKENFTNGFQEGIQIEYDDNGKEECIRMFKKGKFINRVK
jgi:antitoxin component YwqK of YwqJK toxin-antitoxin module